MNKTVDYKAKLNNSKCTKLLKNFYSQCNYRVVHCRTSSCTYIRRQWVHDCEVYDRRVYKRKFNFVEFIEIYDPRLLTTAKN